MDDDVEVRTTGARSLSEAPVVMVAQQLAQRRFSVVVFFSNIKFPFPF